MHIYEINKQQGLTENYSKENYTQYLVVIYNGKEHEKECIYICNAIYSNMDGPRHYHAKWSKSDRESHTSYNTTYMWNLKKKNDKSELIWKTEQTHRIQKQTYSYQREKPGLGVWDWHMNTMFKEWMVKGDLMYIAHGTLPNILW